jgi:hypothetical protein
MKIPDLTVTDLVKNIIGLLIIAAALYLYIQEMAIPVQLDIAFWAVLAAYGFSVAKPVVTNAVSKPVIKPPQLKSN